MMRVSKPCTWGVESFSNALLEGLCTVVREKKKKGCENWKVMGVLGKGNSVETGLTVFQVSLCYFLQRKRG